MNGTAIPSVPFDIGESYAGLLPISEDAADPNQLYFWFFPSTNPVAEREKEILLWVTGGPGCSSAGELMQENGPFLWTPGTFAPIENRFSWHRLTHVVWIDQPVGAGFSRGTPTATSEEDVARQFLGFWRNFMSTFGLEGYKVYVTGSSYSGMYCPYIASAMLDAHAAEPDPAVSPFDVKGMLIFDGLFSDPMLSQDLTSASFALDIWDSIFTFNDTFRAELRAAERECGFDNYIDTYLVFPPTGVQPVLETSFSADTCNLFNAVVVAAAEANPCFSVYRVSAGCPVAGDPLGFASGYEFTPAGLPGGPEVFLNRADVKRAINAPVDDKPWVFCSDTPVFVDGIDRSVLAGPGPQPVLPRVIDATQNVIIGHGAQDFVLQAAGTLLAIQNITFGGQLGFQSAPSGPLFVPYSIATPPLISETPPDFTTTFSGGGILGTAHQERGLTYFAAATTGHFVAQDSPGLAFRAVEVLLGRIESFASTTGFTTPELRTNGAGAGNEGGDTLGAAVEPSVASLGNGTVIDGWKMGVLAAIARAEATAGGRLANGAAGAGGVAAAGASGTDAELLLALGSGSASGGSLSTIQASEAAPSKMAAKLVVPVLAVIFLAVNWS